jgi:uncharacterized protein YodC (DUF2158 family)
MPEVKSIFKCGDVVELKSGGGPKMTVSYINSANNVICTYYNFIKCDFGTHTFYSDQLDYCKKETDA